MSKTMNREEAIEALKAGEKIVPINNTTGLIYVSWRGGPFDRVMVSSVCGSSYLFDKFDHYDTWRIYEPEPELMSLLDAYDKAKPGQVLKRRDDDSNIDIDSDDNWFINIHPSANSCPIWEDSTGALTPSKLTWVDLDAQDWYITDLPEDK